MKVRNYGDVKLPVEVLLLEIIARCAVSGMKIILTAGITGLVVSDDAEVSAYE